MFACVADELSRNGSHALLLVLRELLVPGDDHCVPGNTTHIKDKESDQIHV